MIPKCQLYNLKFRDKNTNEIFQSFIKYDSLDSERYIKNFPDKVVTKDMCFYINTTLSLNDVKYVQKKLKFIYNNEHHIYPIEELDFPPNTTQLVDFAMTDESTKVFIKKLKRDKNIKKCKDCIFHDHYLLTGECYNKFTKNKLK